MLLETEDLSVVKTDTLENTISVKKAVVENRNLGLGFGIKNAVDIYLHYTFSMSHTLPGDKKQLR